MTGAQTTVQGIAGTVASFDAVSATNAAVTNLAGPNNRVNVESALVLGQNVHVGDNTSFIGTIRTGAVESASDITAVGGVTGQNVTATGSVVAGANIESGVEGRLTSGLGGIFVRDRQVFDGNGNLLSKRHTAVRRG